MVALRAPQSSVSRTQFLWMNLHQSLLWQSTVWAIRDSDHDQQTGPQFGQKANCGIKLYLVQCFSPKLIRVDSEGLNLWTPLFTSTHGSPFWSHCNSQPLRVTWCLRRKHPWLIAFDCLELFMIFQTEKLQELKPLLLKNDSLSFHMLPFKVKHWNCEEYSCSLVENRRSLSLLNISAILKMLLPCSTCVFF